MVAALVLSRSTGAHALVRKLFEFPYPFEIFHHAIVVHINLGELEFLPTHLDDLAYALSRDAPELGDLFDPYFNRTCAAVCHNCL